MIRILRTPLAIPARRPGRGCLCWRTHALHRRAPASGLELTAAIHGFGLKGVAVTGLYPGKVKSMTVRITNPYAFSIRVKPLTAAVALRPGSRGASAARPTCGKPGSASKTIVIKAHKTANAVLKVTMPGTVANACQGARFTIGLHSSAGKA